MSVLDVEVGTRISVQVLDVEVGTRTSVMDVGVTESPLC